MDLTAHTIIRDGAGNLFAVRDAGNPDLAHVYLGVPVKRVGAGYVLKTKAREQLVRRIGTSVVEG